MPLLDALVSDSGVESVFSDAAILSAMLRFETALARAEARAGIIPDEAAAAIARVTADELDAAEISRKARDSATPGVPFVESLTAVVAAAAPGAAVFVHRGATSQDVTDTAFVLCLLRARRELDGFHARTAAALRRLSNDHANTVMLSRTLLQPAPPTTFGLKAAGWLGSLSRSYRLVTEGFERACVLQFGGASGTLAALQQDGLRLAAEVARELELPLPDAPWHAHRDRLASLIAACGIYTGAIAKTARDIALLMQAEVAEAAEPGGTSSAMPHKRNPAGCSVAIASASRVPGLVATFLAGMAQEHERGLAGGPAEWATLATAIAATGSAAAALAGVLEHLRVDPARMLDGIAETRGAIFAEQAMLRLAPALGRDAAAAAIRDALAAAASGSAFVPALLANPAAAAALSETDRGALGETAAYLGVAEELRRRLIAESEP